MLAAFFGVALILGLSTTTAFAESASPGRHIYASTRMDAANEPRDPATPTATDEEDLQQAAPDAKTTDSADSEPEPESISGGSEP
jgi:hypothetical protein